MMGTMFSSVINRGSTHRTILDEFSSGVDLRNSREIDPLRHHHPCMGGIMLNTRATFHTFSTGTVATDYYKDEILEPRGPLF
ncbi:hypothetical protein TNCV_1142711 [Trichonephila clavipes]|nr:hypothetical protein TNCV_1142711 [Trichonephila clavipes]